MPPSGSAPEKRLKWTKNIVTCLSPLSGSIPVKRFKEVSKFLTACIARMPLSGSAPAKWFQKMPPPPPPMRNTAISLNPLSGSIPVKLFSPMEKKVTASNTCMPPLESVPMKQLDSIFFLRDCFVCNNSMNSRTSL
eukprot:232103-Amphidinium_carterae.1